MISLDLIRNVIITMWIIPSANQISNAIIIFRHHDKNCGCAKHSTFFLDFSLNGFLISILFLYLDLKKYFFFYFHKSLKNALQIIY